MKAFIAARGLNDLACPECGTKLKDRASPCPMKQSSDPKRVCRWQPGYWFDGKFWSVAPTEAELTAEQVAKFAACPDLVVVTEAMFRHEQPQANDKRR